MRVSTILATLVATLSFAAIGHAQELSGFDRNSFGSVVLKRTQSAAGGYDPQNEVAFGQYNNESITNYSRESVFAKLGLAVGRLDILTDAGVFPCTAFIVDEKHILTNHHCVPGILENTKTGATRIDSVMFITGYIQQGVDEGTQRFTVSPTPVETNKDLDYTVLEVFGNPSREFGTLRLAANAPHDGDPYWVIGHPLGEAQRISREKCRANRPALSDRRLLHTCDTMPGNSGSPVIDASTQMVIGLHHAGSSRDSVNFAIPMGEILATSRVLKATAGGLVGGPETPPPPETAGGGTNLCDALYEEAKGYGQCFAYEAYLEACGDHPYAILAKGYVARECVADSSGGIEAPPAQPPVQEALRPWCNASRLNPTEQAICGDRYLADLDAQLDRAYANPARRVSSSEQSTWRVSRRDACGSSTGCIAREVQARITYLQTAAPASGGGDTGVRGNYTLSTSCYIMTASRATLDEAKSFISQWFGNGQGVRVFRSSNGYYGIALETVSRSNADSRLYQLKSGGRIPSDSYCSSGSKFVSEIMWNGSSGGSTGSGTTMYIDNTSSLNVRTGPGTQYARVTSVDRGTSVSVFNNMDGWANIRLANGTTGWVSATYLSRSKPSAQRQCYATVVNLSPYNSRTRADGSGYLNIRNAPGTKGTRIVSETYLGDTMQVFSQQNGWAQIRCVSGQCNAPYRGSGNVTGWASAKFLSIRCN